MPIPIASIPNIAGDGVNPVLGNAPQGNINLSGVAQNLNAPQLQQGAFDGEAQGMASIGGALQNVGNSIGRVGDVIADYTERKNKFQDDVSLATYSNQMAQGYETYKAGLQGIPESEWLPKWQKEVFPQLSQEAASKLAISPSGQARLAIENQQILQGTSTQLISSASRVAVERGTAEILSRAERQFDEGDDAGFEVTLSQAVTTGAIRQDQADKIKSQKMQQRNDNNLTFAMMQNPKLFAEDVNKLAKGESVPELDDSFKGPNRAIQIKRWQAQADSNLRGVRADTSNEILEGISSGSITNEDQIRAVAGDLFGEREIKGFIKAMEGDTVYDAGITSALRTDIANYDARADKDLSQYHELQQRIAKTAAKEVQGPLNSELYRSYSENKAGKLPSSSSRLKGATFSVIDKMVEQGLLGPTGLRGKGANARKGQSNSDIVDAAAYMSSFEKAQNLKDDVEKFFTENPDASPEQANDFLKSKVAAPAAGAAAKAFSAPPKTGSGWGLRMTQGFPSVPVITTPWSKDPKIEQNQKIDKILKDSTMGTGNPQSSLGLDRMDWKQYRPVNPERLAASLPDQAKNLAPVFDKVGKEFGLDPLFLAAISKHETGNWTSSAFRNKNNAMGISDARGPIKLSSVEESVRKMAQSLTRQGGYYSKAKTLRDVWYVYSPPSTKQKDGKPVGNDPNDYNRYWGSAILKNWDELSSRNT